jgi:hypothetical protein
VLEILITLMTDEHLKLKNLAVDLSQVSKELATKGRIITLTDMSILSPVVSEIQGNDDDQPPKTCFSVFSCKHRKNDQKVSEEITFTTMDMVAYFLRSILRSSCVFYRA